MAKQAARAIVPETHPGFAWICRFDQDGNGTFLGTQTAFALGEDDSAFLWLHLNLADTRARDWLAAQTQINENALEVLGTHDDHQQLEFDAESLWGAFFDFTREFDSTGDTTAHMRFVVCERYIITARRHPLHSAEVLRRHIEAGGQYAAPVELFEALIDRVADRMAINIRGIGAKLDQVEDRVLADELFDERKALLPLRRLVSRWNRVLSGLAEVFQRFDHPRASLLPDPVREAGGRLDQRISSLFRDVSSLSERARQLQDELSAQIGDETNRNLFTLTVLTTLLLPATFVTGLFGMNTKGLPFGTDDIGFYYALALCLVASGGVYLIIRRKLVS